MRVPVPPADHVLVRQAAASVERDEGPRRGGLSAAPPPGRRAPGPGPVRSITDLHSRLMHVRGGGFIQGYNAQNVTSEDGLIIATQLTADPVDTAWFEPMLGQAENAAALITASQPGTGGHGIGLLLADAGYLSEHNLTTPGPDRLIATGKHRDIEKTAAGQPADGWHRTGPATTAMAARLATSDGITAYRHRGHIGERPHGHLKHNMAFRQLSVRGIPRAAAEWKLACTAANLFKAITAGHLTLDALTALT